MPERSIAPGHMSAPKVAAFDYVRYSIPPVLLGCSPFGGLFNQPLVNQPRLLLMTFSPFHLTATYMAAFTLICHVVDDSLTLPVSTPSSSSTDVIHPHEIQSYPPGDYPKSPYTLRNLSIPKTQPRDHSSLQHRCSRWHSYRSSEFWRCFGRASRELKDATQGCW